MLHGSGPVSGRVARDLRPALPALAAGARSDFLKAYQYVNTVKQFRDKEVVMQVRQCVPRPPERAPTAPTSSARSVCPRCAAALDSAVTLRGGVGCARPSARALAGIWRSTGSSSSYAASPLARPPLPRTTRPRATARMRPCSQALTRACVLCGACPVRGA